VRFPILAPGLITATAGWAATGWKKPFSTIAPSLAYRINNWLSVGALFNITTAYFNTQSAVKNLVGPDGQISYKDTAPGIGAGLGVLIEPTENMRFGLTYLTHRSV